MIQYLSYLPSKGSGYGQAVIPRSLPRAIDACELFSLKYCPEMLSDGVYLDIDYELNCGISNIPYSFIENAIDLFGAPKTEGHFKWECVDYERAKMFLLSGHPWRSSYPLGPVTMMYGKSFKLPNCVESDIENAFIHFMLKKSSHIGLELNFPQEMSSEGFRKTTVELLRDLPLKPLIRNFRISLPKASGKGFKTRKLIEVEENMVKGIIDDAT